MAAVSASQLAYVNEKVRAIGDEDPPKYELPLYRTDVPPPATTVRVGGARGAMLPTLASANGPRTVDSE